MNNNIRVRKAPRRSIEVTLPSKPRPYSRGIGPALAPLSLTLNNDLTGQIASKTVLRGTTKEGGSKLQLHYIVGWSDLPAAFVAIPAAQILDYVSSRALEDFEYGLSLQQDAVDKAQQQKSEQTGKSSIGPAAVLGTPRTPTNKKRRGRPGKNPKLDREASTADNEDSLPPLPSTASKPSLSTPQKSLGTLHDESITEDDADQDMRNIDRHLYGKATETTTQDSNADVTPSPRIVVSTLPSADRPGSSFGTPAAAGDSPSSRVAGGFTPAGRSAGKWPSPLRARMLATSSRQEDARDTPVRSPRKREKARAEAPVPAEEPRYEVKRLEGHKIIVADGREERWLLVRWEGDWPAEQNPTWEPEDNLPGGLVKRYLKRKARTGSTADDDTHTEYRIAPVRKYSSVAEAFAGEVEDAPKYGNSHDNMDEDDGEEQLLVEEHERTLENTTRSTKSIDFAGAREFLGFQQ